MSDPIHYLREKRYKKNSKAYAYCMGMKKTWSLKKSVGCCDDVRVVTCKKCLNKLDKDAGIV